MEPLIGAGLSLIGGYFSNQQAKENAKAQAAQAYRGYKIGVNNLKEAGYELNRQIAMDMTNAVFEGMKLQSATSNEIVERNVAGNTMKRIYESADIKETMIHNQLKQKAEASMIDIQNKMYEQKLSYENTMMQIQAQQINSSKSPLEMSMCALKTYLALGGSTLSSTTAEGLSTGNITNNHVNYDLNN